MDIPLKCWSSLISRNARLARIFLEKTLVTFLIATPSPVWLFVAALGCVSCIPPSIFHSICLPDYAIRALAQLLGHIVALIHDELLVEDLEDLAALEICHCVARNELEAR